MVDKIKKVRPFLVPALIILFVFGVLLNVDAGLRDRFSEIELWDDPHNYILMPELSADPSSPAASPDSGYVRMYPKSGKMYVENSSGTVSTMAQTTSSGALGVGTDSPQDDIHILASGGTSGDVTPNATSLLLAQGLTTTAITVGTEDNTASCYVMFADPEGTLPGAFGYNHGDSNLLLRANDTVYLTVEADGEVRHEAENTGFYTARVELTNADIKALRASPKTLVAAPGAAFVLEFLSATILLDYGSEVLTESDDNMVIEYTGGQDVTAAIEATGFIDAAADTIAVIPTATIATVAAANVVNDALRLFNTGDGEYAGNASNDTTMTVVISYRRHATGL